MCKGATNQPCSQPAVWDKQAGIWELPTAFHSFHPFYSSGPQERGFFFFLERIHHTMNDNQRNGCGGGEGDWSQAEEGMEEGEWGSFA